jgi:hypothetical protein
VLELEQTSEACEELKFTVVVLERTVNRAELIQERCSSMRKHMLHVRQKVPSAWIFEERRIL